MEFAATLLAAFIGSGAASGLVTWAMKRDERKRTRRAETADAARDALRDLDILYKSISQGDRDVSELAEIEAAASSDIDKCGSAELSEKFDQWQDFGRRYASREEDAGEEEYRDLLDEVREELRQAVEKLS